MHFFPELFFAPCFGIANHRASSSALNSGPYYGNVTVDTEKVTAEFKGSTLYVRLSVKEIPAETEERELKIVAAKRMAKAIKFPANVAKKSVIERELRDEKKSEKKKRKAESDKYYDKMLEEKARADDQKKKRRKLQK